MATFNHTRGDSPRTPCGLCALHCADWEAHNATHLRCVKCRGVVSLEWLTEASSIGAEHACDSAPMKCGGTIDDRDVYRELAKLTARGLSQFTDDALRAECERRSIIDSRLGERYEKALKERFEIVRGRDEWRRRAEIAEENWLCKLDDWKRRAEAAEAKFTERAHGPMGMRDCWRCKLEAIDRLHGAGRLDSAAVSAVLLCESGPGIAASKPRSEPHAHLDVDLLCEDA